MYEKFIKVMVIIFLNLFAFLSLGIILGAFFETGRGFLVLCVIVSIVLLLTFLYLEIKKTLEKFDNISNKKTNDNSSGK